MKPFVGLLLIVALASCRCEDPEVIDLGPVPDTIMMSVPYRDGGVYSFRHSAGQVIHFNASRESREERTWCEWRCCEYVYKYQVITTSLRPDFPVFDLGMVLSSHNNDYPVLHLWVGRSAYYLPMYSADLGGVLYSDSLLVGDRWYREVYKLPRESMGFSEGPVYPDTLVYNFSEGILRIMMSNDEYYEIEY